MKIKLTIVACEKTEFTGKDDVTIQGYSVGGFTSDNQFIQFWSKYDHDVTIATKYVPGFVEEVELTTRMFGGKVKYKEVE